DARGGKESKINDQKNGWTASSEECLRSGPTSANSSQTHGWLPLDHLQAEAVRKDRPGEPVSLQPGPAQCREKSANQHLCRTNVPASGFLESARRRQPSASM